MKARTTAVAWVLALCVAGGLSVAKDKEPDGQALYKEFCKPCHMADSPNGEYTPMTLIQEQWERFFDEKLVPAHKDVVDPHHGDQKVLEELTPEMIKKIRKFAVDHAADSEHPMTCG